MSEMQSQVPEIQNEAPRMTYDILADAIAKANGMNMDMNQYFDAFMNAGGMSMLYNWPQIQNQRVKGINTRPADLSKNELVALISAPEGNEKALRSASASLAYSTTTYDNILRTYADVLTYFWYTYPAYTDNEADHKSMMRDMVLVQKLIQSLDVKGKAHELCGLCEKYGKIFVTPRISVDKSHNKVNYAFLQQLPTDFCKIVGYNNGPGKYTVAFNLMYFAQPGTAWQQYGDLFRPYMPVFQEVVTKQPGKYVYNQFDRQKFKQIKANETIGNPEWVQIGKEVYYWVTLPADKVFTFEADDTSPLVVPPFTGMFVSLTQIPNYEAAQMELILNPLTSVLTGELETSDTKGWNTAADPVRVGPAVRKMFENMWYQMLNSTNTAGIGIYLAPAKNLKLQTISDNVSNTNIAANAYNDQVLKAGLTALIPTTADPKVGVAQLSASLTAQRAKYVYGSMEKIVNWAIDTLNLKTPIRFKMFGDIFSASEELENARKGMTSGLLIDTLKYNAILGHTILDDIAISSFVEKSGVLDNRIPLVTSYSAKQSESMLPPQAKKEISEDGRPAEKGSINAETHEEM